MLEKKNIPLNIFRNIDWFKLLIFLALTNKKPHKSFCLKKNHIFTFIIFDSAWNNFTNDISDYLRPIVKLYCFWILFYLSSFTRNRKTQAKKKVNINLYKNFFPTSDFGSFFHVDGIQLLLFTKLYIKYGVHNTTQQIH